MTEFTCSLRYPQWSDQAAHDTQPIDSFVMIHYSCGFCLSLIKLQTRVYLFTSRLAGHSSPLHSSKNLAFCRTLRN